MRIRTKYKTNAQGRGQVIARNGEHQRTITFDPARSSDYNHGAAAGTLAKAEGLTWHDGVTHKSNDSGTEHVFEV